MPPKLPFKLADVTGLTRVKPLEEALSVLKDLGAGLTKPVGTSHPAGQGRAPSPLGRPGTLIAKVRGVLDQVDALGLVAGLVPHGRGLAEAPRTATPTARTAASAGGTFAEHRYTNAFGTRSYRLYTPGGARPDAMPLVVMLHGCTQSPADFAAGTRMNELAEELGFFVAYPEQPSSANPSRCWNWFSAGDQIRDKGEPSLIAGITHKVVADVAVDPARVYIAGLSAGGAQAAIMGSAYPDLYAAICVHSGLACGAAKDMASAFSAMRQGGAFVLPGASRPVPTIVFHGDADQTVNPINGTQVIAQAKADRTLRTTVSEGRSVGGIAYTRTVQSDAAGTPVLEHWFLRGAGHAWSGGSAAGSYTEPRGPDASREAVRFFLEHTLH